MKKSFVCAGSLAFLLAMNLSVSCVQKSPYPEPSRSIPISKKDLAEFEKLPIDSERYNKYEETTDEKYALCILNDSYEEKKIVAVLYDLEKEKRLKYYHIDGISSVVPSYKEFDDYAAFCVASGCDEGADYRIFDSVIIPIKGKTNLIKVKAEIGYAKGFYVSFDDGYYKLSTYRNGAELIAVGRSQEPVEIYGRKGYWIKVAGLWLGWLFIDDVELSCDFEDLKPCPFDVEKAKKAFPVTEMFGVPFTLFKNFGPNNEKLAKPDFVHFSSIPVYERPDMASSVIGEISKSFEKERTYLMLFGETTSEKTSEEKWYLVDNPVRGFVQGKYLLFK